MVPEANALADMVTLYWPSLHIIFCYEIKVIIMNQNAKLCAKYTQSSCIETFSYIVGLVMIIFDITLLGGPWGVYCDGDHIRLSSPKVIKKK